MRARVQRAAARRLIRAAGSGLLAVDGLRGRWSHSSEHDEDGGDLPTTVVAAVAHWREPDATAERSRGLAACVESLLDLDVDQVVVVLLTNESQQAAEDLARDLYTGSTKLGAVRTLENADALEPPFEERRQVFSVGWEPGRIARAASRTPGFYLTWGHKAVFRSVLRDPSPSLLIYLEDDIKFTGESLVYWCRYRKPLAEVGLLPGFVRYEERDGVRYVVDQVRPQVVRQEIRLPDVDGAPTFTALENPYQGMYVLDRSLADRHLRLSPYRRPLSSSLASGAYWNVRERAAAGPIYDDVPPGFRSRNVVPIQHTATGSSRLDPICLLEHMGRTYVDQEGSPFGKLRLEDVFEASGS